MSNTRSQSKEYSNESKVLLKPLLPYLPTRKFKVHIRKEFDPFISQDTCKITYNPSIRTGCIELFIKVSENWRRVRDSNPRYPFGVYTLSRRAPSTTRTTLHYPCFL